jgi:hypothetical protein
MPRILRLLIVLLALTFGLAAQARAVEIDIAPEDVGIAGRLAPGQWNGMRLQLRHTGQQPREVICRWLLNDRDGDRVITRRRVTLNPGREQPVWLYAAPPADADSQPAWTVQVLDAETETLLASSVVGPRETFENHTGRIGILGSAGLNLQPFQRPHTRHEPVQLTQGLELNRLPDRWFGLAPLDALVWTRQGGAPDQMADPRAQQALRNWVRRGGHLVVSLPAIDEPWSRSALADLLPVSPDQMRRREAHPPAVLGPITSQEPVPIDYTVFDLPDDAAPAVLATDDRENPLIVAQRRGYGRVTVIGVDLANPAVRQMGLPQGKFGLWHRVFRWQAPVLSQVTIDEQIKAQDMARPSAYDQVQLDQFVPTMLAMRNTAAPVMLAAVVLFGIYWLLAGPISYLFLRQRGMVQYAWLGFVAVVLCFLAISWGGALLSQPGQSRISHYSVVTASADEPYLRSRSWFSLFVPAFGETELALNAPAGTEASPNTLASPGLPLGRRSGAGFTDQRTYELDAAAPDRAAIPFRATARQLQLDYMGPLHNDLPGATHRWDLPEGEPRIENFWPAGTLRHGLPGTLHDVLVIYCPGDGEMPWVWRHGDWAPGESLDLAQRDSVSRLVKRPGRFEQDRQWAGEGFLGQLIDHKTGQRFTTTEGPSLTAADNELVQAIEMLTFYSALPAPNFRRTELTDPPVRYQRTFGRALEITHLTAGPRLILVGHLKNAPLPAPLTAADQSVPAEGWTTFRWSHDLEPQE